MEVPINTVYEAFLYFCHKRTENGVLAPPFTIPDPAFVKALETLHSLSISEHNQGKGYYSGEACYEIKGSDRWKVEAAARALYYHLDSLPNIYNLDFVT